MNTLKNAAIMFSMAFGPFLTIGIITYYRRALEWWYFNEIGFDAMDATSMSWVALISVSLIIGLTLAGRAANVKKQFWWEK